MDVVAEISQIYRHACVQANVWFTSTVQGLPCPSYLTEGYKQTKTTHKNTKSPLFHKGFNDLWWLSDFIKNPTIAFLIGGISIEQRNNLIC